MPSACLLCSVFEPILSHWKYDDGSVVVLVCYKLHFVYRMAEGSDAPETPQKQKQIECSKIKELIDLPLVKGELW